MIPETEQILPLDINLVITQRNGKPSLELRKVTTDEEIIKQIISCAFHGKAAILRPTFKDPIRAIATLTEKGIIYKEQENYYFTI